MRLSISRGRIGRRPMPKSPAARKKAARDGKDSRRSVLRKFMGIELLEHRALLNGDATLAEFVAKTAFTVADGNSSDQDSGSPEVLITVYMKQWCSLGPEFCFDPFGDDALLSDVPLASPPLQVSGAPLSPTAITPGTLAIDVLPSNVDVDISGQCYFGSSNCDNGGGFNLTQPPIEINLYFAIFEDTQLAFGTSYTASITSSPTHGSAALILGSAVHYTPNANFSGSDTFRYRFTKPIGEDLQPYNVTAHIQVVPVNDRPSVAAGPDFTLDEGTAVNFEPVSSFDVDGDSLVYAWDFGDGTSAVGTDVSHSYPDNGVYTATLTVSDGKGGHASDSVKVTVSNVPPQSVNAGPDRLVFEGQTVTLSGSFTDPGILDSHVRTWTVAASNGQAIASGSGNSFQFIPSDNGVYTVTFTVKDDDNGVSTDHAAITVQNVPPKFLSLTATPANEGNSVTLSGEYADDGTRDTHTVDIDWGPEETPSLGVVVSSGLFSVTHEYLDDKPTGSASDAYLITVALKDDDAGSDTESAVATVSNMAPTLSGLSATPILENGTTSFSGKIADVGTLDTFTVEIDWNNDGTYDDTYLNVGAGAFSYTHQYLDDNPTGTAVDNMPIKVKVTDDDTGSVTGSTTVEVTNLAPVIVSFNSSSPDCGGAVEGQSVSVAGSFADIGTQDTHNATINWGDGTATAAGAISESTGSGSITANHVYVNGGIFTITITLTDDDGATIVKTAQAVITGAGVNNGVLYVIGTEQDDYVTINAAHGSFKVHSDFYPSGAPFKSFSHVGVTQLVVVMCHGKDKVQVASNIVTPTFLDGGEGDDQLNGGAGNNIILGGSGDDKLLGGSGRDLLIGGNGADDLGGNSGEDLLIGGRTDYDGNHDALASIMAEWARIDTTNGTYEARRNHLRGVETGGLNGGYLLTTGTGGSVHDDGAVDKLNGSSGRDLYFANVSGGGAVDKITGGADDESIFDLL